MTTAATERVALTKIVLSCSEGNLQFEETTVHIWDVADDLIDSVHAANVGTEFFAKNRRAEVAASIHWADGTILRVRVGISRDSAPDCLGLAAANQFKYLRSSGFHNKTTTNVDLDGFHDRA